MVDFFLNNASKHYMMLLVCGLNVVTSLKEMCSKIYIHMYPAYHMATRVIITPVTP